MRKLTDSPGERSASAWYRSSAFLTSVLSNPTMRSSSCKPACAAGLRCEDDVDCLVWRQGAALPDPVLQRATGGQLHRDDRDPFDPGELAAKVAKQTQPTNPQLSPDPNRTPEFLESFPLDTLRMVGTLSQGEYLWALIRTPDSTIQRVSEGNYMGQNYGKIVQVSDVVIKLTEIIPDGYGGWRERASSVALSE